MKCLLCHGFCFGNDYWENLAPLLGMECEFFDPSKKYDDSQEYIGIGHSIGFQKLNNSGIKFKALIGLQGFVNFCGDEGRVHQMISKNLDKMIRLFSENVEKARAAFVQSCKYDKQINESDSLEILLQDLEDLKRKYNHCGCKSLVIGTTGDPIILKEILKDNFSHNPNVTLKFVQGEHHVLGWKDAKVVSQMIQEFLNIK